MASPGVSERVGNDATAPYLVVKRVVDVPVAPEVCFLQQRRQVAGECGVRRQ